jgi:hypothetical protein
MIFQITNSIKSFSAIFNMAKPYRVGGGAKEDRTPDLLRARQALSQLSYGPNARFLSPSPDLHIPPTQALNASSPALVLCKDGGPRRT